MNASAKSLLRHEGGNVVVTAALLAPVLLGMLAFGVDLSGSYFIKTRLQTAADAAALAAAIQMSNTTTAQTTAVTLVADNVPPSFGTVTSSSDVTFGYYDSTKKTFTQNGAVNAVQVVAKRTKTNGNPVQNMFASILGSPTTDVTASAIAIGYSSTPCFIALSSSAAPALSASGGGKLSVPGCGIWVNSSAYNSISAGANTSITARSICTVGNYSGSNFSPIPTTACSPASDPLASVAEPAGSSCMVNGYTSSGTISANPGTYCGSIHLTGSGTSTLNPGVYYFKNAQLVIDKSADFSAQGVLLFFDANSSFTIASSGTINISAQTSGTYKGIAIFQSRSAAKTITNSIKGSPTVVVDGTIYTPTTALSMSGSGSVTDNTKVGYVIANTFAYTGSSEFTFTSTSGNVPSAFGTHAALVQ